MQTPEWAGLLLCALATITVPRLWSIIVNARKRRYVDNEIVSRQKCQSPPRLAYRLPLALDIMSEAFRADRANRLLGFFEDIVNRTGNTFEQILLGNRGVDTQDPKNIEAVLSTQFSDFSLGARCDNFRPLLGHGIFTTDGPSWKASRDLLRPQFKHTGTDSFPETQAVIEKFVTRVKHLASEGIVDMQEQFFRLTLDTTMAILFGRKLGNSAQEDHEEDVFADAFDKAQHVLAQRGRLGDLYWALDGWSFRRSCRTVHRFVDNIVASALADSGRRSTIGASKSRYVFLEALMSTTRDPVALRDQCINVLLAGRDTTACLLSWTLFFLARNPEFQQLLRNECIGLASYMNGDLPDPAELKDMKLLDQTLKEVLRLYPSVPVNSRSAVRTTTLPMGGGPDCTSPVLVREGEAVGYCVYTMHRRKDLYGEDANEFRPSRWAGDNLKGIGWGYIPFNGGPRICPGQDFALLQSFYTVVRLLQTFRSIKWAGPGGPERQTITLVVSNADGCKVELIPAD